MTASHVLSHRLPTGADHDLADRHRYGDESAFAELYERFAAMVYGLCLRLCGDPVRAQDLSQDVFLRVWRGLPSYRGRSTLKTWIYRITLNHCRSRLGRRRLELTVATDDSWDRGPADARPSPEDELLARDDGRRVAAALLALPARFREAVVLRDLEGLSYDEIAVVLSVRTGTVRSRIARGRERLRLALEQEP